MHVPNDYLVSVQVSGWPYSSRLLVKVKYNISAWIMHERLGGVPSESGNQGLSPGHMPSGPTAKSWTRYALTRDGQEDGRLCPFLGRIRTG